jgi:hypothetical protein
MQSRGTCHSFPPKTQCFNYVLKTLTERFQNLNINVDQNHTPRRYELFIG